MKGILRALLRVLFRVTVTGDDTVFANPRTLIVANHESVLYLEDLRARLGLGDKLWILWHQVFPDSVRVAQSPEDPAIVLFTSGSEGKPKGVVHSHASILSNVAEICALADFTPLDKFMIALPVFHSFGLTCGAIMPLVSGCKVFPTPMISAGCVTWWPAPNGWPKRYAICGSKNSASGCSRATG